MTKHGLAGRDFKDPKRHKLYATWVNIRQRCRNPRHERYSSYGGRTTWRCPLGIYMDGRWDDFARFVADVGERPGPTYSLDRVDNDGPYAPGNVVWSTAAQQRRNQYRSKYGARWEETPEGAAEVEQAEYAEWCERNGVVEVSVGDPDFDAGLSGYDTGA